jgi:hypothetical protein
MKLKTIRYDLESTYAGIYDEIVSGLESLKLAPYNLETYKKKEAEVDQFEAGREQALVGTFKSRYLKRFESSVDAFRISVRRALAFLKTFESFILDKRLLRSTDFHRAMRFLLSENEEDDATPRSLADEMDANDEARRALEQMDTVDHTKYDLRRLHEDLQHDVQVLSDIWQRVKDIRPKDDTKLAKPKVNPRRRTARQEGPHLQLLQRHCALPLQSDRQPGQSKCSRVPKRAGRRHH